MRDQNSAKARFMKAVDQHSVDYIDLGRSTRQFIPADEATMACFLCNDVIKNSEDVYATVETKGEFTSGQVVVDWNGMMKRSPNVTIVRDMDQLLYEQLMAKALL